jgi:hypothetical protein
MVSRLCDVGRPELDDDVVDELELLAEVAGEAITCGIIIRILLVERKNR